MKLGEFMDYEEMLSEAYEKVDFSGGCERFEVKKVEGHHEGTKTMITNFLAIASCLRREPDHIAKFLFKELAAPGEIAGDRLILTRKVSSQQVNEKIEKYVNKFVTCTSCGKPDSEIVKEEGRSYLKCLACGTKKEIQDL
jgi:translation initiation factor 2 subunit 2